MQAYKSTKNLELDAKLLKRQEQKRGEIPFELEGNTTGKNTTTFTKPFDYQPHVHPSLVITEGDGFNVSYLLTTVTQTEFTIHIQNTGLKTVKGIAYWDVL